MSTSTPGENNPFANDSFVTDGADARSDASKEVLSGEVISGPGGTARGSAGSPQDSTSGPVDSRPDGHAGDHTRRDSSDASASGESPEGPRYLKTEPLGRNPFHRDFYVPHGATPTYGPGAAPGSSGARGSSRTGGPANMHFTFYSNAGPYGVRGPAGPGPNLAKVRTKSPFMAGFLGLLLGPFGLLYANVPWAIGLGLISWRLLSVNLWLLLPAVWILCGAVGFGSALRTNAVRVTRAMQQDMEEAQRKQGGPGGPAASGSVGSIWP